MNALADKVHKQEVQCMRAVISSSTSGTPVGTKFTATYVGTVVE